MASAGAACRARVTQSLSLRVSEAQARLTRPGPTGPGHASGGHFPGAPAAAARAALRVGGRATGKPWLESLPGTQAGRSGHRRQSGEPLALTLNRSESLALHWRPRPGHCDSVAASLREELAGH